MHYLNHAVKVSNYHSVALVSLDTDTFVCVNENLWLSVIFDLNKFWFISDRNDSTTAVAIHDLVDDMNADVIYILPPVHALYWMWHHK